MNEIEKKLFELWELLSEIPDDCKGEGQGKSENRLRYLRLRRIIGGLVKKEKVCGTCVCWQEGYLDRGICFEDKPLPKHSADTCENWKGED